jgi:hypothetical protein
MDLNETKILLGLLEDLNIDTQPIRDLLLLVNKKECVLSNYSHILETIKLALDTGNFTAGTKPLQIDLILRHLQDKILSRELESRKEQTRDTRASQEKDMLILSTLIDIKRDIDIIKTKQPVMHTNSVESNVESKINMDSVFINPIIDNSNLKATFSVKEKIESNIFNKLDKLKQLKRSTS